MFDVLVSDRLDRKRTFASCYERAYLEAAAVRHACWIARMERPGVIEYDLLIEYEAKLLTHKHRVGYYEREIERLMDELKYPGWTSIDTSTT